MAQCVTDDVVIDLVVEKHIVSCDHKEGYDKKRTL